MNPNPKRFNKERWDFGKMQQTALLPFLEKHLGETIEETTLFYDTMDGKTKTWDIEVKSRTAKYHWENAFIQKEGWLIPTCKIDTAKKTKRPTVFFYTWASDGSVWELVYEPSKFEGLTPKIPFWHKEQQEHFYVPQDRWTRIY